MATVVKLLVCSLDDWINFQLRNKGKRQISKIIQTLQMDVKSAERLSTTQLLTTVLWGITFSGQGVCYYFYFIYYIHTVYIM